MPYRISAAQYSFTVTAKKAINSEATLTIVYEPESGYYGESTSNDSFEDAMEIQANIEYWGIGDYDVHGDYDYCHFTLNQPSQVSISLKDKDKAYYWIGVLYKSDSSGETALCSQSHTAVSNGSSFDNLRLPAGSYYVRVFTDAWYNSTYSGTKGYYYMTLTTKAQSSDTNEIETNNLSSQASLSGYLLCPYERNSVMGLQIECEAGEVYCAYGNYASEI